MKRVLVSDNSFYRQKVVGDLLSKMGIYPVQAMNGKEAISMMNNEKVDLLIYSLFDPVNFIKEFRVNNSTTPIILISSDSQKIKHPKCEELGVNSSLPHALNLKQLQSVVSRILFSSEKQLSLHNWAKNPMKLLPAFLERLVRDNLMLVSSERFKT